MRKKRNVLKRNSGFLVGCVIAAGASFLTADTLMSNGVPTLPIAEAPETDMVRMTETIAQESSEKKVYETDPFTVTASGNVIKGIETEKQTEKQTKKETEPQTDAEPIIETDENGNPMETLILDASGNIVDSFGGSSGGEGDSYSEGSGDTGSYDNGSGDGNIDIYDPGNGNYYYDNSWDSGYSEDSGNGGSADSGSSGSGNSGNSGSGSALGDFWSDSIMPQTYSQYITEDDLSVFSNSELRLIRNEIFARHGRIFYDEELSGYFGGKAWYNPMYSPDQFDANMDQYLTACELANLDVIISYENSRAGY